MSADLQQAAEGLLKQAGLHGPFSLETLPGGANNRVYRIDNGDSSYLLKAYFRHPQDPRDRQGNEFSFSKYAWAHGIHSIPEPLASDPENHICLYQFIPGRKLKPEEVTEERIREALNFYLELNQFRENPSGQMLADGSEASFSFEQHFHCVQRRIERLSQIETDTPVGREADTFIRGELLETWKRVEAAAHRMAGTVGLDCKKEIKAEDRRISPSDFGFHNAILTPENNLRFIDFEYAGWDDPAKMVCDFFCQPAVPVPADFYKIVADAVSNDLSSTEVHRQRMDLLLPVYQVKWCCILLNEFLPVDNERRRFASGQTESEQHKITQLEKARRAHQHIRECGL